MIDEDLGVEVVMTMLRNTVQNGLVVSTVVPSMGAVKVSSALFRYGSSKTCRVLRVSCRYVFVEGRSPCCHAWAIVPSSLVNTKSSCQPFHRIADDHRELPPKDRKVPNKTGKVESLE